MNWPLVVALIAGAYLLGSIPFSLLLGLARGRDIRLVGSGNPGATNLGRELGMRWAVAAFLLDFGKGLGPVLVARLATSDDAFGTARGWVELAVGAAAVLGHVFPIWLRFRGGKGVATGFGVMMGLVPLAALAAGAVWGVVFFPTRTVALASMIAGASLPVAVWLVDLDQPLSARLDRFILAIGVAVLIVVRHQSNIARLIRGKEQGRFEKPSETPPADTSADTSADAPTDAPTQE